MITLPHLETNITTACQCRCVACTQMIAMQVPTFADPAQIERDIYNLKKVAFADRYAIVGGEPTLHKGLLDILDIVRLSGITKEIEVWTNGMAIKHLPESFWGKFNTLYLSLYPGKVDDEKVKWIDDKCRETGRNLIIKDARETSYFAALLTRQKTPEEARKTYIDCAFRHWTHALNNGYFYRCCTSVFIPRVLWGAKEGTDALSIKGITEQSLQNFLDQKRTPASCFRCTALCAPTIQWSEERDPEKWIEKSTR